MARKGIDKAIDKFLEVHGAICSGKTYSIVYINEYDESDELEVPVDAGASPIQALIESWEDYLTHDAPEDILEVTEIRAVQGVVFPSSLLAC